MQRRVALGALGALRRAAPRATLARPALIVTDSMRHATAPKMRALRAYSTAQYTAADLDVSDYSKRVDTSLDALTSQLEELIETEDIDEIEQTRGQGGSLSDWDVEYATGVLNLRMGTFGTYVINKQPPSRQIWLSSPTSGPKRFDYDIDKNVWFTYKDGQLYLLHELLNSELSAIFGSELDLAFE